MAPPAMAVETRLQRADLLTRYIQEQFWNGRERTYLDEYPRKTNGLPYSTLWGLGIEFSALTAGVKGNPNVYRPWMDQLFDGLDRYLNRRKRMYSAYLGGTMDIYYDDNQWMILDYIEAYEVTRSKRYLDKAAEIADACLSGVDSVYGGGSYWHIDTKKHPTKNTCSNAPLATGLLRLSRHVKDPARKRSYAKQGEELLVWLRNTLQGEDGIMWDHVNVKTGDKKRDWTFTYNTALVIQAHLELYRIRGDRTHLTEAIRLSKASKLWLSRNSTAEGDHYYRDAPFFVVHLIEAQLGVYDVTRDGTLLADCRKTADFCWRTWRQGGRAKLIDLAAAARMQWVLAKYDGDSEPKQRRRSVRIELPRKGTLTLAEVEILSNGENIARGSRALQCSTYGDCYANLAIDGNTDGRFRAKSLAHTGENESSPWWEVEISPAAKIDRIRVWNRTDAVPERLDGARVLILDEKRKPVWEATIEQTPKPKVEFGITP
ncbi:MAG: hypothetical protein ISS72_09250 [Candidatus Brocadiae bacterium]|nr:hypothetical protein [Candidatus Brocadiia bacterium]